jgi:2-keto-4-pentenoate hydratase/2-oxohepta-3-ene-1,7-dioic acid hydratase in catechol pathway
MKIRRLPGPASLAILHEPSGRWISLRAALNGRAGLEEFSHLQSNLLALLATGEQARAKIIDAVDQAAGEGIGIATDPPPAIPYYPSSLRCFLGWEQHWINAAHGLVQRNLPVSRPIIRGYERLTRKVFPLLRPGSAFYDHPVYYTGNHLTVIGDGEPMPWPSYTNELDFELEFGMIIAHPVRDATPEKAAAAIGGFVVFNDFSARDVQWDEQRRGVFGPVVKTKTFGSSIGSVVVTADEVLPKIDQLTASVRINGELWSSTGTHGLRYHPGEVVAYASQSENLHPGELITSGTLPSGCGLEFDRWIRPGDEVTLSIDGIGSVTNTVAEPG